MKNVRCLILLALCFSLVACEPSKDASARLASPAVDTEPKIYVFGDEITMADGIATPYTKILEQRSGLKVVVNAYSHFSGGMHPAGSGPCHLNSTNNAGVFTASYLKNMISPNDTVVYFSGYNDARYYGNTANLTFIYHDTTPQILQYLYDTGAQVYVVTPIKMLNPAASYTYQYANTALPDLIVNKGTDAAMATLRGLFVASVASFSSNGIKIIDLQNNFPVTAANYGASEEFPSQDGHLVIGNYLATEMGF